MAVLSPEQREQILGALRDDASFRDEMRRALLSAELLALPDRFAAFVEEMHGFVEEMHAFVEEMHAFAEDVRAFVASTDRRLGALESSVGSLKGTDLEHRVETHPMRYLLGAMASATTLGEPELVALAGAGAGDDDLGELVLADAVVQGRERGSREPLLGVVEVSWRAHTDDVERAHRRATILARLTHARVLPIVVSQEAPGEAVEDRATARGVTLMLANTTRPLAVGRALVA